MIPDPPKLSIDQHLTLDRKQRVMRPLFPQSVRPNGIHLIGAPGTGKSRLLGRGVALSDFISGMGQVIIDPAGGTIDNFLDPLNRIAPNFERCWWEQYRQPLPPEWVRYVEDVLERIAQRIIYVDMSGKDAIMPFPLYQRLSADESLSTIAQRPLEVIHRLDPNLESASVEGWNALFRIGQNAGMILTALQLPITEAPQLLNHPERWKTRFEQAKQGYPEVQSAIDFFLDFARHKPDFRVRRSDSFLSKIDLFLKDPRMRAMFGASTPGIDWQQVIDKRQTVLLDFRHEYTLAHRRFKLVWVFTNLLTFLISRGFTGRTQPLGLIIDELTQLIGFRTAHQSVMAEDIRVLLETVGRNYGAWTTLAHQNLSQIVEPAVLNSLMQMGTQCIGAVTNPDEAEYLARQLYKYEPYKVKKTERVWMKMEANPMLSFFGGPAFPMPKVIDYRTTEYSVDEQRILTSYTFRELGKFQFLTKVAADEGDVRGKVELRDFSFLDPGEYPNEELLAETRRRLAGRSGYTLENLLAEIEQRAHRQVTKKQVKDAQEPATLNTNNGTSTPPPKSITPEPSLPAAHAVGETKDIHEQVWQ